MEETTTKGLITQHVKAGSHAQTSIVGVVPREIDSKKEAGSEEEMCC